jgi:hypothetical protein
VHEQTAAVLHPKNLLLTNFEQTFVVCGHCGTQPDETLSTAQYKMNEETIEPNCMKPIFEVCLSAAGLYKVLDDVQILATPMRETLGVVQDEVRNPPRGVLFLDI